MPRIGGPEILVLALIVLLLFGASRLPKLARAMREARDEFEAGKQGDEESSKPPSEGSGEGKRSSGEGTGSATGESGGGTQGPP